MDTYATIRLLGEGACGRVFLAREKRAPRRLVCIKQVHATASAQCRDEIKLMERVWHPNLVRLLGSFSHQSRRCIAMEFCAGGDLRGFLAQTPRPVINEDRVWYWTVQLCLALSYLHTQQPRAIWHRDVKTSNVFLTGAGFLVLGDLGVAREASVDLASTVIGTPWYMAPEIWDGKHYDGACDLWALGCLIYEVCTGRTPFESAASTPALIRRVCEGKYTPLSSGKWSPRLCTLVSHLLIVEPTQRPSATSILQLSESRLHLQRYLTDRVHAADRSGTVELERAEQAILRSQLGSIGVATDEKSVAMKKHDQRDQLPLQRKVDDSDVESELRLQVQREHERQELLRRALDRVQELRAQQQQQIQQLQEEKPVENRGDVRSKPIDESGSVDGVVRWKAPERDGVSQRPASSRRRVSPVALPVEFIGIPRHGVPVTKQASAFAAKTQSPLCRDVRVLRKQEFAKAADRYKATLEVQFNRKKKSVSSSGSHAVETGDDEAIASLEAALQAQLTAK